MQSHINENDLIEKKIAAANQTVTKGLQNKATVNENWFMCDLTSISFLEV
jgi:hypothetical protein